MEEKQTKKECTFSPKLMFVFGVVTGIAIFAILVFLYSFLALTKIGTGQKVVINAPEEPKEIVNQPSQPPLAPPSGTSFGSFIDTGKPICKKDGKPIIRLFATTWCPHCEWIKETFDKVAKEYMKKKKIVAYHWYLDTNDDGLTEEVEKAIPPEEEAIYQEFNPTGSIPTFVFGCRYYRIGNAYEREKDAGLLKEEKEFRELIEKLLKS